MKSKMRWWKKVLLAVAILILLIIIIAIILFWRVIRTAASVEKLEDGLYSMEYQGDYHFDGFLEAGGASSDLAVADYVIQDIAYGLVDLHASAGMMVHFAIADAAGRSVVVEYIDNEMSVVDTSVATSIISIHHLLLRNGALSVTNRQGKSCITTEKIMIPVILSGWIGNRDRGR